MSRKVKLLALLLVLVLFTTSGEALAKKRKPQHRPNRLVSQSKDSHKNAKLISAAEAQNIVKRQLGTSKVKFLGSPDLNNKAHDYPINGNYRPVYSMKCISQGSKYNVDVDAITGQVLKLAFAR